MHAFYQRLLYLSSSALYILFRKAMPFMTSLWIGSGAVWPLNGLGVTSPDHRVGAHFEALAEGVLVASLLHIGRVAVPSKPLLPTVLLTMSKGLKSKMIFVILASKHCSLLYY